MGYLETLATTRGSGSYCYLHCTVKKTEALRVLGVQQCAKSYNDFIVEPHLAKTETMLLTGRLYSLLERRGPWRSSQEGGLPGGGMSRGPELTLERCTVNTLSCELSNSFCFVHRQVPVVCAHNSWVPLPGI